MLQRVMLRFSVETFLSHSTETFRRGTFLCSVSENFWWRKRLWKRRGEGGLSKLSVENFLSQVRKYFVEEPFCAVFRKNFWRRKSLWKRRGRTECRKIPSKNFLSQIGQSFHWGTLQPFISFGYRKYLCFRRLYHDFPSKTFCLKYRNIS